MSCSDDSGSSPIAVEDSSSSAVSSDKSSSSCLNVSSSSGISLSSGEVLSSSSSEMNLPGMSSSSVVSSSSMKLSSSSAFVSNDTSKVIQFLAAKNGNLYQDITFAENSDGSYSVEIVPEVDLSNIIPSFAYGGTVSLNGTVLTSGNTKVQFPDTCEVSFDGKKVAFYIKRAYAIPVIKIETLDGAEITSKDVYTSCSISVDAKNMYADYSASDAEIRLRGNSTRIYYDKKPYKLKLGSKFAILGLKEEKDWVLLANYRDPTNFMNAVVFDMANYMEMPYTNSNRFVEVYLNGAYIGMYQLTEQVEQGKNRVAVNDATGVLLNLDVDDGPEESPNATDNFSSTVYSLPIAVKYPESPDAATLAAIKSDFAKLEDLIKMGDYDALSARLDIASMIDFLIIQELSRNVELVAPRSMYMYRSADSVYHFGPVWDFDGGFAFDWASMSDGHNYFGSDSWVLGSSNPSQHPLDSYNTEISDFFVGMFANEKFLAAYKARWNELGASMLSSIFAKLDDYVLHTSAAMARNAERWPIDKDYATEISNLRTWLSNRISSYSSIVNGY